MRNIKIIILFIFLSLNLTVSSYVFANNMGTYSVDFKLPSAMQWVVENDEQDDDGYVKTYRPQASTMNDQSLTINYGHNIQISLLDSMQQVLNVEASANCQHKDSKILQQQKNTIIFTTRLDQCENGKSLWQIYKVFNMPDGQYSINYAANPNLVSSATIQKMEAIVKSTQVVR